MENLDNIQSSERVEAPKSGVLNIQTKLPADTNVSKGQEETPINGVPEFNLVMRNQPEDKEYWERQAGNKMKFGESADDFFSRTVLNPIHSSMFGSQSPQLSREELSDFGLDKAQKESIIATAGGNPKNYTDEDVYRATYPIDETKFGMSRANVMEASENEADYNMNYNKAIQQELVDAGYDLGNTGDNMDGVDGIMGKKTRAAADEFQAKKDIGNMNAVPTQFGNGSTKLSTKAMISPRTASFLDVIKVAENNKNMTFKQSGYKKDTDTWHRYESLEGGTDTIGFGHKLSESEQKNNKISVNGIEYNLDDGLNDDVAKELLQQDWVRYESKAKKHFGEDWGSMSEATRLLATEIEFNIAGGLSNYPTFTKLARNKRTEDQAINEIGRGYTNKKTGEFIQLSSRVDSIKDWYNTNKG